MLLFSYFERLRKVRPLFDLLPLQECYFQDLLPEETDIVSAAGSIFRLQEVYRIPTADLAQGRSLGAGLSVGVLTSLLSTAFTTGAWESCEGWGQEAFLVLQGRWELLIRKVLPMRCWFMSLL